MRGPGDTHGTPAGEDPCTSCVVGRLPLTYHASIRILTDAPFPCTLDEQVDIAQTLNSASSQPGELSESRRGWKPVSARRMNGVGSRIPNAKQVGYAGNSTVTRERDIGGFSCYASTTRYPQSVAHAAKLGWHHEDHCPSSLADGGLFDSLGLITHWRPPCITLFP